VTGALRELGGNLEDASMTRLGGEFAIMMIGGFPASASAAKIQKALGPLAKKFSLQTSAQPVAAALARFGRREPSRYLISVYGHDKPGLIYEVARALAERRVSITDLNTQVLRGTGAAVYVMMLEIQTPPGLDLDGLRSELDRLRAALDVEITLQDFEAVPL